MTARTARGGGVVMTVAVTLIAAISLAIAAAPAPAWGASGGAKPRASLFDAARSVPNRAITGIVQAVGAHAVLVRQLDGRSIRVPVGPRANVFVDGSPAQLSDLRAGFVVTISLKGTRLVVRASNPGSTPAPSTASTAGIVQSVSSDAVVVTAANGGTVTIAVAAKTQVFLNDAPVSIGQIAAGDRLVKVGGGGGGRKPAHVLRFRRPG